MSALSWSVEMILEAMEVFAQTGRGFVRNMLDRQGTFGLYVSTYLVLFARDAARGILVLRVRQRRR